MKTSFYNRTAYTLPNMPAAPRCFIELDEYFDTRFTTPAGIKHEHVILAENLCRRMADVELYASYISKAKESPNALRGAILVGTLLVGYFVACKSLLDAGAITLAKVYVLSLTNKETDFSKQKFWKELDKKAGLTITGRYAPFKGLFKEIIEWRDSVVHRFTPFTVTHSPDDPDKVPRGEQEIKMVARPDTVISTVVKTPKSIPWVEPLHFHRKWRDELIGFCGEVCQDIQDRTS